MADIPKNSVALAGEYAVLSQLMLRGHLAAMTLGNTKKVDILVWLGRKRQVRLEVKTNYEKRNRSNKKGGNSNSKLFGRFVTDWQMHKNHEQIKDRDLFYCFVHINMAKGDTKHSFRFFIVPSRVVAKYVHEEHRLWLRADRSHNDTDRRLFRIGLPNERKVRLQAPLATKYEDKWELLRE